MNTQSASRKHSQGAQIFAGLVTLGIIIFFYRACMYTPPVVKFASISRYDDKVEWLQDWCNNMGDERDKLEATIEDQIKMQCKYPLTVTFDNGSHTLFQSIEHAKITDAEKGELSFVGNGSTKNALGVPVAFIFNGTFTVDDYAATLETIKVQFDE